MTKLTLQEILDSLPKINASRKYWFVRTNAGEYYDNFRNGEYIAIGYNKITLADIKAGNTRDETGLTILSEKISKAYGEEEYRPGHAASQLLKFAYDIKKGDIVLIPGESSSSISFGEVKESAAYIDQPSERDTCPYRKRKKVKWLKTISRDSLDPNLYKLMYSHHTITSADDYDQYIDKIINSFFIKDQTAFLVLDVQAQNKIKAKDLFEMGSISLQLLDEFCAEENLSFNSDEFNVRLNLQSPGVIELSGMSMGGIVIIGIILVAVAGGGFSFSYKKDIKSSIKTDGIIEKIRRFLSTSSNVKMKRKILEKHMENLQIQDPEDLIKVLKELDK